MTTKVFLSAIFSLVLGALLTNTVRAENYRADTVAQQFPLEKIGRNFQWLSIHPNETDWLISECSRELKPEGDCYVLRYDQEKKQLFRYALPEGYLYSYARFSPKGNYIVVTRIPNHDGSDEQLRRAFDNAEIVIMRFDGTDFNVLPVQSGNKMAPFMSPNEDKVSYWRAGKFIPGGKRVRNLDFEIWEYDLKNNHEALFSGSKEFLTGGNAQYMSEDTVLVQSYAPHKYVFSLNEYLRRFNYSEVYQLTRNEADIPTPSFTDLNHTTNPSIDLAGNIYVGTDAKTLGYSFARLNSSGGDFWQVPGKLAEAGVQQILVSPGGSTMAFRYLAEGTRYGDGKQAFGQLDLRSGHWSPVDVPDLKTSIEIKVVPLKN